MLEVFARRHSQTLLARLYFQPNRNAVTTGLSFINFLCTSSCWNWSYLKLIRNNKKSRVTLKKGRIGFSSLDVVGRDLPGYQIRSPYELTSAVILLMNDTMTLFPDIPQFQHRGVTISYRSSVDMGDSFHETTQFNCTLHLCWFPNK